MGVSSKVKMKYLYNILATITIGLFVLSCSQEQNGYTINGTVKGAPDGEKVILYGFDHKSMDSTIIAQEKFVFTGSVEMPVPAEIYCFRRRGDLVLNNTNFETNLVDYNSYVSGSALSDLVFGYLNDPDYIQANKEFRKVYEGYGVIDKMDKQAFDSIGVAMKVPLNKMQEIKSNHLNNTLKGNHSKLLQLIVFSRYGSDEKYDYDYKNNLIDECEKELGENAYLTNYRKVLKEMHQDKLARATVIVGKQFKDMITEDVDGKMVKLSELVAKNKYTLLEIWASWCGPCRAQFPHLKKAYKKYHDKGFEIYALSMDTSKERWVKAMEEENVPWLNTVDYKAFKGESALSYGVKGIPAAFLINSEGIIVATGKDAKGFELDEKLKELLK